MTKFYLFSRYLTVLLIFITTTAWSQGRTVTGKVTSADDGSAIPGVNIVEKGTSNGTISSVDGTYTISVSPGAVLVFSFVGYSAREVSVGEQTTVNVSLQADVTALSEVVVIGYGEVERRDATGAITSLKPEDFNAGVISSPEQLIQGRAAGVQITSASGEPGAGINIRIRGTSSVRSGNNPLFVIDGVPLSNEEVSNNGMSGAINNGALGNSSPRNPLNFLNPNDIASMDILKDASATAIYGSRGANGVVLITTKSGKSGKGAINYSYNLSLSSITKKFDLLNRNEFLAAYEDFNGPDAAADLDRGSSTDWQDEILRTAVSQQHNLSFGAGDETGNYRLSFGYLDQEGIVMNSGLKRYSARFNGSKSFINDRLTLGTQMTIASTVDENVPITNNVGFEGDLFGSALKANPTWPVRNPDGTLFQFSVNEPNPVAMLKLSKSFTNTLRALGNVSAELEIMDALSFKTVLGFDRSFGERKTAYSRDLMVSGITQKGRLYLLDTESNNILWENYFTYDKSFNDNIKLNALLGYSFQRFVFGTESFQFTNFRTNDLDLMINNYASADQNTGVADKPGVIGSNSSHTEDELQSFFGRVNIGLSDKYIFTATLRADGSTRFGGDNKYGFFPSAAFKWRASDEEFIPEVFSDLNVRLGYGLTGNQEIPHNLYDQRQRYGDWTMNNDGNVAGGGLVDVAFQNPQLKWESTAQFNSGIDFGFFGNRLRGSLDFYHKNTSDLLIQITSAQPAAQQFVWTNLDANIINQGVEIAVEADVVDNTDFTWTVIANIAFNKNIVKNFGDTRVINTGEINGQGLSGAFAQRIANKKPLYAYYLRDFAGYNEAGIAGYYDAEGNIDYTTGGEQRFIGKSPLPKANAGLTNNFAYKSFDLSLFFSGQFGQYIYSNTANAYFTAGALANGRNVTQNVVGNGEDRLNAPDVSTRFLENGSFVRLQNVTLGYKINTQNTFISSLRVFVTGQNLFVITDYSGQDPEVNNNKALNNVPSLGIDYGAYPRARTFTFGVNASF